MPIAKDSMIQKESPSCPTIILLIPHPFPPWVCLDKRIKLPVNCCGDKDTRPLASHMSYSQP